MGEFFYFPLVMPSPTRFGNINEKDSYPDIFFVSDHVSFMDVCLGPRLSDHTFCQCTFHVDLEPLAGHHVFDFRATYQNHSDILIDYFDNIDVLDVFTGCTIDGISDAISDVILEGWRTYGVVKFVNCNSEPWYTPKVKSLISEAGRWQRRYRRLRKGGKAFGVYNLWRESYSCRMSS